MCISLDFLAFAFCFLVEGIRNGYKMKVWIIFGLQILCDFTKQ